MTSAAPFATGLMALLALGAARLDTSAPPVPESLRSAVVMKSIALEPATAGRPAQSIRAVNPAYAGIDGWISAVGAAAALGDLDGDGLPNDICLVDPRYDSVSLIAAPGSDRRYPTFALEAPVAPGIAAQTVAPMGCLFGDFDEDGSTDVLVYYWGRSPVLFLRAGEGLPGAGAFRARELLATPKPWFTNAGLLADVDGDGHPDLLFGNYFPDDAAVLDPRAENGPHMQTSMSRAFNGGGLHLFLWDGTAPGRPEWRKAPGVFPLLASIDPLDREGPGPSWTLALGAADLDGDLRPEIYVANDFGPDLLLHNRTTKPGQPRLEPVTGTRGLFTPRSKVVGRDGFKGMGVDFASVTGDGRPAIAVSNIAGPYSLIEGHFLFVADRGAGAPIRYALASGQAPFIDEGDRRGVARSSWSWDIRFADLLNSGCPAILQAVGFLKGDRDRWPELQELATGNDLALRHPALWPRFSAGDDLSGRDHDRLYLQACGKAPLDGGRFHDVSLAVDLGRNHAPGAPEGTVSRGIATGDVHGDGRLSVVIARQWSPSVFLCNESPDTGQAIVLDVRAPGQFGGTRPLIGAVAEVRLADGRVVTGHVDGGSGHSGKKAPEIHLGLGEEDPRTVHRVTVRWRDATGPNARTIEVAPGRYTIVAGSNAPPQRIASQRSGSCA
jgi:hypothetical protein